MPGVAWVEEQRLVSGRRDMVSPVGRGSAERGEVDPIWLLRKRCFCMFDDDARLIVHVGLG